MIGVAAQLPRRSRTTYRFKEACIQITVLLGDAITVRLTRYQFHLIIYPSRLWSDL